MNYTKEIQDALYEALKEASNNPHLFGRISRRVRDKWEKALDKAEGK